MIVPPIAEFWITMFYLVMNIVYLFGLEIPIWFPLMFIWVFYRRRAKKIALERERIPGGEWRQEKWRREHVG